MDADRTRDLETGMMLIPEIGEVMPEDATGSVAEIYDSIRRTLRVPFVNFIFRVLAHRPTYLEAAWMRVQPAAATFDFERAADLLRSDALVEDDGLALTGDWEGRGDLSRIRPFTDAIHYVLPKLLLVATAWDEAARGDPVPPWQHAELASESYPTGAATEAASIDLVDPEDAPPRVRTLFDDIRETHQHPGVASYYRALGHWPDFLEGVWTEVKPLVTSADYGRRREALVDEATRMAHHLSLSGPALDTPRLHTEIRSILAVFRFRLIPDLLLDVAAIKRLLDGTEAARTSTLSVT